VLRKIGATAAAVAATPLAIALAFALVAALPLGRVVGVDATRAGASTWMVAVFASPVAAAVTLVAGLPLALWLERRGDTAPRHFLALGALLGAVPFLLFDLYVFLYELAAAGRHGPGHVVAAARRLLADAPTALAWLALGAWSGGCSALAYWRVALRPAPAGSPAAPVTTSGGEAGGAP
jgi:hypothetical protein